MGVPVFEQIMQDIESRLETIPALTGKTLRGEPFTIETWPFAHVARRALTPESEFGTSSHRVTMDLSITIGVAVNPPENLETALAALEATVFSTLYGDTRLGGLGDITWLGDDEPTVGDEEGHGRQIQTTMTWQIAYTTAFGDPYTLYTT
jgi:hypothetical protein